MNQIQVQQPDIMGTIIKGAEVLCNFIIDYQRLENERLKIEAEFALQTQKISAAERVALEDIDKQKMVITKSFEISSAELKHLALSRDVMYQALNKLVDQVIDDDTKDKGVYLRAIEFIREEISCLREETSVHFERINAQTMKSLESGSGMKILEGGVSA